MNNIDLVSGAQRAAQILAEGKNWRDLGGDVIIPTDREQLIKFGDYVARAVAPSDVEDDRYYHSEKGSEYGADEADIADLTPEEQQAETKARKQVQRYVDDLVIEGKAREGIFSENDPEFKDPSTFKTKKAAKKHSEKKADGRTYTEQAIRQKPGAGWDPARSFDYNKEWRGKVFDKDVGESGEWVIPPPRDDDYTYVYPEDSQKSKEYDQVVNSGTVADRETLRRLNNAIENGQITDPAKLEQAIILRDKVSARVKPQEAIARDRKQAQAAVLASASAFNPRIRGNHERDFNKFKHYVRQYYGNVPNNISRLGEIQINLTDEDGRDYIQEIPRGEQIDPSKFPMAYKYPGSDVYMSPFDGASLATDDYNYAARYGANAANASIPGTSQELNAPQNTSLDDLIERELFTSRRSGTYPQVSIGTELDLFAERLRGLGSLTPEGNLHVRSKAEADALLQQVLARGADQNVKFFTRNASGKNVFVEEPGISQVFEKMRYNGNELKRLMNSLYQLNAASETNINTAQKDVYLDGGSYMPQKAVGQPTADLRVRGIVPGAEIPGKNYYSMDSAEQMSDYAITDNIALANAKNAPKFRALTGGANPDATPGEQAAALADAQRSFVGQLKDEVVPIEGKEGNPNYRFIGNKERGYAEMSPADVSIAITAQRQRQLKPGQVLTEAQQTQLGKNINNALEVQRRANEPAPVSESDAQSGQRRQEKIQSVMSHINRDKPAFTPAGDASEQSVANAKRKIKGMRPEQLQNLKLEPIVQNDRPATTTQEEVLKVVAGERAPIRNTPIRRPDVTQEERMGVGRSGIPDPQPARENFNPNAGKTVVELGDTGSTEGFYPGITKGGMEGRAAKARHIMDTIAAPQHTAKRRVGYALAGAAGLGGLAGLLSRERDRREEERV